MRRIRAMSSVSLLTFALAPLTMGRLSSLTATFGALLVLVGTILLALVWVYLDKKRDREDG